MVGRLTKAELGGAEEEYEASLNDPGAWEADPAPARRTTAGLAAQVTVRLSAHQADQLRRVAAEQGIRYTALLRTWVGERLADEDRRLPVIGVAQVSGGGKAQGRDGIQLGNLDEATVSSLRLIAAAD